MLAPMFCVYKSLRRRDCVRVLINKSSLLRLYDVMVRYNLRKVSLVIVEEGRKLCGQVRKLGCWKVPVKKRIHGLDMKIILNISYALFFTQI